MIKSRVIEGYTNNTNVAVGRFNIQNVRINYVYILEQDVFIDDGILETMHLEAERLVGMQGHEGRKAGRFVAVMNNNVDTVQGFFYAD